MRSVEVTLKNKEGLHARPASIFINMTGKFQSTINIVKDGNVYNAKSIINILSLGVKCGETILLEAEGEDEEIAIAALVELINNNFGE
jgi:phosphocarrier protein